MTGCIYKLEDGRCDKPGRYLSPCIGEACTHQTPSNYDRIVSMTPEELADFIVKIKYPYRGDGKDYEIAFKWLKAPAEKEGEG